MKTATIGELRASASRILSGDKPVLITRNGEPIGVFDPLPDPSDLPIKQRRKLYRESIAETRKILAAHGITEEQIDRDIGALRKPGRRR